MRCSSYCTGESYNISAISAHFTKLEWPHKIYGYDVLHLDSEHLSSDILWRCNNTSDIFIFNYGCIIFWGTDDITEEKILQKIFAFLSEPLAENVIDRCNYIISPQEESYVDEEGDSIVLKNNNPYIKLSFSYGLSQSVKLSVFEASVEKTIDENKKIPYELINTGKISLSRQALAKKIGSLFAERNFVNLNSDILDTPDFFWRRPQYEPYYEMAVKFMDIRQRTEILNRRLAIIHELYGILSAELQHAHSSRLELIIILLILLEVILVIVHDLFGIV